MLAVAVPNFSGPRGAEFVEDHKHRHLTLAVPPSDIRPENRDLVSEEIKADAIQRIEGCERLKYLDAHVDFNPARVGVISSHVMRALQEGDWGRVPDLPTMNDDFVSSICNRYKIHPMSLLFALDTIAHNIEVDNEFIKRNPDAKVYRAEGLPTIFVGRDNDTTAEQCASHAALFIMETEKPALESAFDTSHGPGRIGYNNVYAQLVEMRTTGIPDHRPGGEARPFTPQTRIRLARHLDELVPLDHSDPTDRERSFGCNSDIFYGELGVPEQDRYIINGAAQDPHLEAAQYGGVGVHMNSSYEAWRMYGTCPRPSHMGFAQDATAPHIFYGSRCLVLPKEIVDRDAIERKQKPYYRAISVGPADVFGPEECHREVVGGNSIFFIDPHKAPGVIDAMRVPPQPDATATLGVFGFLSMTTRFHLPQHVVKAIIESDLDYQLWRA